jgi:thiamine-monophosphate kinase
MSNLAPGPEFDFIRMVARLSQRRHPLVRLGPGDDCAILGDFAISTDVSVENVHFRRDWITAEEIGWRAAGAALSDLAAVAAEPVAMLVSIVFPDRDRGGFAEFVMRGAIAAADATGATLIGGDVAAGESLVIDVVVMGTVAEPVLRSGAKIGDEVWVTGRLGGAAAACRAWEQQTQPPLEARRRYAHPYPQIAAARWLHQHVGLSAMIDLSDGLYGDAAHIAAASGCRIDLDAGAIPVDTASGATFEEAVAGGDDFELCFTAPPGQVDAVRARFETEFSLPLTRVGSVSEGAGVHERARDGSTHPVERAGYQHFKDVAR